MNFELYHRFSEIIILGSVFARNRINNKQGRKAMILCQKKTTTIRATRETISNRITTRTTITTIRTTRTTETNRNN